MANERLGQTPEDNTDDLRADVKLLGNLLGDTIREQHGQAALDLVETIRTVAKNRRQTGSQDTATTELAQIIAGLSFEEKNILIKAFSNFFQLINIAEDQQRVRVLRRREMRGVLKESIEDAIGKLHQRGLSAREVQHLLDHLRVRFVLTAHPSEAKRNEILLKLREITGIISQRDRQNLVPREERLLSTKLVAEIEELWQTRATRTTHKSVADEVDFGLYFITSVIMDVAIEIYEDLVYSLNKHYPDANWQSPPAVLRYGSWIGGDRDGNPNVSADVTLETLATLRKAALNAYLGEVAFLRDHLTLSLDEIGISEALQDAVRSSSSSTTAGRYPVGEVYRQFMNIIYERLATDSYKDSRELLYDLLLVDDSLRQNNGVHVANSALLHFIRKVRLFGLHLTPLDIREDARLHAQALDELMRHYGIVEDYLGLPETDKQALLSREIANPRPFFPVDISAFSEVTQRVIATWRMIAEAHARYSPIVIDTVIASMSQEPSDTLAMLLMATEVNVQQDVDLVPLFETIDDLYNGSRIMTTLFNNPEYRKHLEARGKRRGLRQQIMIGYSDSSKDGGYLASNWNLYHAQQMLTDACAAEGVSLQLFHGRGGSIGRGGGPANRSILAQPPESLKGGIKITEQGEVIAYRYGNADIARRHLNQVMHASLLAMGSPREAAIKPEWAAIMDQLAESGRKAYRALVYETDGFLDYWQQGTPINELAQLQISSRPAKRSKAGGFDSIRAIPWVFSWMQNRAIIPSWYGVGTAIAQFCEENENGIETLRQMYAEWPFFNGLMENTQLDVAKADMGIAGLYASLVEDETLRDQIFGAIKEEHDRAVKMICWVLNQDALLDNTPVLRNSIERRNPYVDPLNFIQVSLVRELRTLTPGTGRYKRVLESVLATVNGIAAGMKTTG